MVLSSTNQLIDISAPELYAIPDAFLHREHIRYFVIVGRKQRTAFDLRQDMVERGIGDRQARVEGRSPSDLIHDDERPRSRVSQYRSGSSIISLLDTWGEVSALTRPSPA